MKRRNTYAYRKYWDELIAIYGRTCFYCREEIATSIDHVVPYSYDVDNTIENLVPACALCNQIASDKVFDSVEHKRQHILNRRKSKTLRRAICVDCLIPFSYLLHSPSLLLCADCYDYEYFTEYSKSKEWKNWLGELEDAGIFIDAHKKTMALVDRHSPQTADKFIKILIGFYQEAEQNEIKESKAPYTVTKSSHEKQQNIYKYRINTNRHWLYIKNT